MFLSTPHEPSCTRQWSSHQSLISSSGASPDGVVQCECCGNGVLEIKCPYNAREHSISDAVMEGIIDFLETTSHGIVLKQSHQYFYQIQAQIGICAATYADLVVWTTKDCLVTRIIPSHNFFIEVVQKVKEIYCSNILPELLGKWWSKQKIRSKILLHVHHS